MSPATPEQSCFSSFCLVWFGLWFWFCGLDPGTCMCKALTPTAKHSCCFTSHPVVECMTMGGVRPTGLSSASQCSISSVKLSSYFFPLLRLLTEWHKGMQGATHNKPLINIRLLLFYFYQVLQISPLSSFLSSFFWLINMQQIFKLLFYFKVPKGGLEILFVRSLNNCTMCYDHMSSLFFADEDSRACQHLDVHLRTMGIINASHQ